MGEGWDRLDASLCTLVYIRTINIINILLQLYLRYKQGPARDLLVLLLYSNSVYLYFFTRYTPAFTFYHPSSATAESAKTLIGLVTVDNTNKIATRLVYDTLGVESVWANRIEGAPMPRHQII